MSEAVEYLDLDDVVALARRLLGDTLRIRDVGLLNSAVARPSTSVMGEDAYPDVIGKAAALLQSIVHNHALVDGNKRLGWLCTTVFLELNGFPVEHISNDAAFEFVWRVAATNPPIEAVVALLRALV